MKKLLLYFYILFIFGCSGYEPIFSVKNMNFNINNIENIDNKKITEQIVNAVRPYKLDDAKKNYSLEISSLEQNKITSRDSKGNPLTYRVSIDVKVDVFIAEQNLLLNTINLTKEFTYNYQINQFELGQYKIEIIKNLVAKISKQIILELQLL